MADVYLEIGREVDELRKKQIAEIKRWAKRDTWIIKAQLSLINKLVEHMEELSDVVLDYPTVVKWVQKIASPEHVEITHSSSESRAPGTIAFYWGKQGGRFLLSVYATLSKLEKVDIEKIALEVNITG